MLFFETKFEQAVVLNQRENIYVDQRNVTFVQVQFNDVESYGCGFKLPLKTCSTIWLNSDLNELCSAISNSNHV